MKKILVGLLFLVVCGCASMKNFQADSLRENLSSVPVVDSEEVEKVLAKRAQLPKPFQLDVYFKQPTVQGEAEGGLWSRWSSAEREKIFAVLEKLPREEVKAVFPISSIGEETVCGIRAAATRQGADAVLIISGSGEVPTGGATILAPAICLFSPLSS